MKENYCSHCGSRLKKANEELPALDEIVDEPKYSKLKETILNANKITNFKILDDWEDDHMDCFAMSITFDTGETIEISKWWTHMEDWTPAKKTEKGKVEVLEMLQDYIS